MKEAQTMKFDTEIHRLSHLKGYIREAWKLALARKKNQDKNYKKKSPFIDYSESTQILIEKISDKLLSTGALNEEEEVPFQSSWTEQDIRNFFRKNKKIHTNCKQNLLVTK